MISEFLCTCGACGHRASIDEWSRTEISGALPLDVYQCPRCRVAIRKRSPKEQQTHRFNDGTEWNFYPDHPDAVSEDCNRLVYVEGRL